MAKRKTTKKATRKRTTKKAAPKKPTAPPRKKPVDLIVTLDHEHLAALERLAGNPVDMIRHLILKAGGR